MIEEAPFGTYTPGRLTRLALMLSQNTFLGRGKARRMMAGLVRRWNPVCLDTHIFGLNARLYSQNNSSEIKALMNPARYSRQEVLFAQRFLQSADSVFVDIGANAGLFALAVCEKLSGGTVIAVEPQPALFQRLETNLKKLNPALKHRLQLHLFQEAIGDKSGVLNLFVPEQVGQASLHGSVTGTEVSVSVRPLLDLLQTLRVPRVNLLKIDVEGYEDKALLPFFAKASRTIWPRAIILEHCHRDRWEQDCEQGLLQIGYKVRKKDRTNLMLCIGDD